MDFSLSAEEWEIISNIIFLFNAVLDIDLIRQHFLQQIGKIIAYEKAVFFLISPEKKLVYPIGIRCDKRFFDSYLKEYKNIDYLSWLFHTDRPIIFRETDYIEDDIKKNTTFYRDFAVPNHMYYRCGFNIVHDGQLRGVVMFIRSHLFNDFSDRELFFLKKIQPHIACALNNAILFKQLSFRETIHDDIHDNLAEGIMIFNYDIRLNYVNKTAKEVLHQFKKEDGNFLRHTFFPEIKKFCHRLKFQLENSIPMINNSGRIKFKNHSVLIKLTRQVSEHTVYTRPVFLVIISNDRVTPKKEVQEQQFTPLQKNMIQKHNLTAREQEIFKLVIEGLNNKEIGEHLFISIATVKTHLSNIYYKLDVQNRNQLFGMVNKITQELSKHEREVNDD